MQVVEVLRKLMYMQTDLSLAIGASNSNCIDVSFLVCDGVEHSMLCLLFKYRSVGIKINKSNNLSFVLSVVSCGLNILFSSGQFQFV